MNINQCLVKQDDFDAVDEFEITAYDSRGNVIKKPDGTDETITVGVRAKGGITWREKKELSEKYYEVDISGRKNKKPKTKITLAKGEIEMLFTFAKWYRDETGQHDFTNSTLEALPSQMIEQIEEHLPSSKEILGSLSVSRKKK